MIYDAMIEINEAYRKITISKIAKCLGCSTRTVHRHMSDSLKEEKQKLNEEV